MQRLEALFWLQKSARVECPLSTAFKARHQQADTPAAGGQPHGPCSATASFCGASDALGCLAHLQEFHTPKVVMA